MSRRATQELDCPEQSRRLYQSSGSCTSDDLAQETDGCATWIEQLKQLVRLKEIFVADRQSESKLVAVVNDVVLRNAATLMNLHMSSMQLPFDPITQSCLGICEIWIAVLFWILIGRLPVPDW